MISLEHLKRKVYDLIVIGAGPAGVSAAINAGVRKKEVLLLDPKEPMRKIRKAKVIPNYPGFPSVRGSDLAKAFLSHLGEMGVEIKKAKVSQVSPKGKGVVVYTEKETFETKGIILALGVICEKKIPGEEKLVGEGVSYCVTCDGTAYEGKRVAVVADSKDGEEEARALAEEYSCDVSYIPQYKIAYKLLKGIRLLNASPQALKAQGDFIEIDLGKEKLKVKGVFIIRKSLSPATIIEGLEMRGDFISVDGKMATSTEGIFAAGDCTGPPFQIAKAVGQGQIAALSAVKYLSREGR